MRDSLRNRMLEICQKKIEKKGADVGVSFYAFFANKNDNPELLMEAATWWIQTHRLDHFEKAQTIIGLLEAGQPSPPGSGLNRQIPAAAPVAGRQ